MNAVRMLRDITRLTQAELASAGGTSQSAIAAYETGRKSPTVRTLSRLAASVGLEATVQFHPPLTREERRSLFLHRAIARKLVEDPEPVLQRARRTLKLMWEMHPGARPLLREWQVLLDRAVLELVPVLLDLEPRARELRHVTPFAGVLSARERAEVYEAFRNAEGEGRATGDAA